jgi:4-amino-4-deoxy-L-arabinose transferase-like glycosyltransferase
MTADTLIAPGRADPRYIARTRGAARLTRLVRGRPADPRWVRPALLALLLGTGILYVWDLGASGWANSFYSAAVQAGSQSWKAFFFGSSDAANSITVDKTPAALWVMGLSVRIFGLNSWSILVPEALEGVAAVGVLYLAVRRVSGATAGLVAGAVFALTPVAALMFRFNNPDALLVLLLTLAGYCLTRALERAATGWLALVGVLVGFAFLAKMLQALLVVPAFALAYLIAAPNPLRRRIVQLLVAGAAMVASAGWWIAIVELLPAKDRPYIGGSQHNSILELTLGYNGLGRLTGNETGSVAGGGPQGGGAAAAGGNGGGIWGSTGWGRLFGSEMGTQASWLLPTALLLLVAGLVFTRRAVRTDRTRAALIAWGGWLIVTGVVFSYAQGIIHPYYTVALAPAIGAVIGITATMLWRRRAETAAGLVLAVVVLVGAVWQFALLDRTYAWLPWLRYAILMLGVATALLLLVASRLVRRVGVAVALTAVVASLAGPAAYAVSTAGTPHEGAIPSAGPAGANGCGAFGGPGGALNGGALNGGALNGGGPGAFGGGAGRGGAGRGGAGRGGAGALLGASTPSAAVVTALNADAARYTWVAATIGSNSAAGFQLATGKPVMPVGGFNGSDPSPTLAQFQAYVAADRIHYFIAGGGFGGAQRGGSDSSAGIAAWVQSTFASTTVGAVTLYDLTQPAA